MLISYLFNQEAVDAITDNSEVPWDSTKTMFQWTLPLCKGQDELSLLISESVVCSVGRTVRCLWHFDLAFTNTIKTVITLTHHILFVYVHYMSVSRANCIKKD